jgi:galactan endo-1,6-beta-galactosidase
VATSGLQAATNIMLDLVHLQPTAWMLWQIVDVRRWGLVDGDVDKGTLGGILNRHFVLAQFTRHIRRGMEMISGGQPNTVAAYDAAAHKLVIVSLNSGAAQKFTYDLSRFGRVPADGAVVRRWSTDTGSGDRYRLRTDTQIAGKRFSAACSTSSIQTFEIDGVHL